MAPVAARFKPAFSATLIASSNRGCASLCLPAEESTTALPARNSDSACESRNSRARISPSLADFSRATLSSSCAFAITISRNPRNSCALSPLFNPCWCQISPSRMAARGSSPTLRSRVCVSRSRALRPALTVLGVNQTITQATLQPTRFHNDATRNSAVTA